MLNLFEVTTVLKRFPLEATEMLEKNRKTPTIRRGLSKFRNIFSIFLEITHFFQVKFYWFARPKIRLRQKIVKKANPIKKAVKGDGHLI